MKPRTWRAAPLALLATLVLAGAAEAAPYEPNDTFLQAAGPLSGGRDYVAAIETANDVDYYFFNTNGQRQIDASILDLGGSGCGGADMTLRDTDGEGLGYAEGGTTVADHILYTAPRASQFVLEVDGYTGCNYRMRVEPSDALTGQAPGLVATIGGHDEADGDEVQRLLVDGRLIGEARGSTAATFVLGRLPSSAQITFEASNASDDWAYAFDLTNQTSREVTTVFHESESGYESRIGVVRRVVLSPSGALLQGCGEVFASITCIPVDRDGDGFASDRDCDEVSSAVHPGAAEVLDNAVDENCDGVAAKRVRYSSSLTIRRKGKRYFGRVSSTAAECVSRRRVILRRKGRGTRVFGVTTSRRTGRFSIRRSKRLRGRVYVAVATKVTAGSRCTTAQSRRIRG
jgi:hypothetical protein